MKIIRVVKVLVDIVLAVFFCIFYKNTDVYQYQRKIPYNNNTIYLMIYQNMDIAKIIDKCLIIAFVFFIIFATLDLLKVILTIGVKKNGFTN